MGAHSRPRSWLAVHFWPTPIRSDTTELNCRRWLLCAVAEGGKQPVDATGACLAWLLSDISFQVPCSVNVPFSFMFLSLSCPVEKLSACEVRGSRAGFGRPRECSDVSLHVAWKTIHRQNLVRVVFLHGEMLG